MSYSDYETIVNKPKLLTGEIRRAIHEVCMTHPVLIKSNNLIAENDGKTVIYNQDKFAINGQEELGEIKEIIKSNGVKTVSSNKQSWFGAGGKKYTRRVKHGSKTKKHFTSHLDNKKSLSKHKRRKTNRK